MRVLIALLAAQLVVGQTCVDSTGTGWWNTTARTYALPPPTGATSYVFRPSAMSACELATLHQDCVDRINMYRSGALKFSDGTSDTNVVAGLSPLAHQVANNICISAQALGDVIDNVAGGGGCAGAHAHAFKCPWGGGVAENSCCGRGGGSFGSSQTLDTYAEVKAELFSCLQSMWDEGITAGQKGHWETMRSTSYNKMSCGFGWTATGRVMMIQNFMSGGSNPACSCTGKAAGDDAGCGGPKCASAAPTAPTIAPTQAPPTLAPTAAATVPTTRAPTRIPTTLPPPTRAPAPATAAPGKPMIYEVVTGSKMATVYFGNGTDNGGAIVYQINVQDPTNTTVKTIDVNRVQPVVVDGIENDVRYRFSVTARNAVGNSPRSDYVWETPSATGGSHPSRGISAAPATSIAGAVVISLLAIVAVLIG